MSEPDRPATRGMRTRFWGLFAVAGGVAFAAFSVIGWIVGNAVPDPAARAAAVLQLWLLALLIAVVSALAWWLVYHALFRDVARFTHELWIAAHGDAATQVALPVSPLLHPLAETARLLAQRLAQARRALDAAAAAGAIRVEREKLRLESILRDLTEAVVVCDLESRILLYNDAALRLLQASGEVGLGRPLFNVVSREPVAHTLDLLRARLAAGAVESADAPSVARGPRLPDEVEGPETGTSRPGPRLDPIAESADAPSVARGPRLGPIADDVQADFIGSSVSGNLFLRAHMRLIIEPDGGCRSYVLALTDATQELEEVRARDSLLAATTEGLRAPVANLLAATETLASYPTMPLEQRKRFEQVILGEARALQARLEGAIAEQRTLATRGWLLFDIHSADLLAHVARSLRAEGIELTPVGAPLWLRGDSLALAEALGQLLRRLHQECDAARFDAQVEAEGRRVFVDLIWNGKPVAPALIEAWLNARLPRVPGTIALRDVVERHDSELWSEALDAQQARLRFPLPAPQRPQGPARERLPPRPVFYDFELLHSLQDAGPRGAQPLRALSFVVFDTETTGLRPQEGDEIVALAGVRVVNARVLAGERFERLIDPRILIPADSTAFHGITDEMVRGKPPIEVVLRQFHAFCGDAVLVAHNAAFDMKFVTLKQAAAGVAFERPVLDTLLLTAAIGGDWLDRSLDGIAARLGVSVRGRHTALGDTLATAEVFVRLIPLLEAAGITTLDQALQACRRQIQLQTEVARAGL